jgi:hypothetical protein
MPSFLDETLRDVARRYRLPELAELAAASNDALAVAIERVRVEGAAAKPAFIDALAHLIRDALHHDPVFKAMLLRHRMPQVREYASLVAHAEQDRRAVVAAVNSIAHPARVERMASGPQRDALARLHAYASSSSWNELADDARLPAPALTRLQRVAELEADKDVRAYRALCEMSGPRAGTSAAVAQGAVSKERGAAGEASAARAIEALAHRMNLEAGTDVYRVVTSMRVPSAIPSSHERAKTEWDVALLQSAAGGAWNVCLLVEAKASPDAATTDFPRLLRGMELLAHAEAWTDYTFETQQGPVALRGASLRGLTTSNVLYCCDAPADSSPRLLNAASRMQLLSASASLEYAGNLADTRLLDPVWQELLESPRWRKVLHQYPMLREVRELMVHADDLLLALERGVKQSRSGNTP